LVRALQGELATFKQGARVWISVRSRGQAHSVLPERKACGGASELGLAHRVHAVCDFGGGAVPSQHQQGPYHRQGEPQVALLAFYILLAKPVLCHLIIILQLFSASKAAFEKKLLKQKA